jgi:ribosomal protein S18 acetylase RimI-like enzyme
MVCRRFFYIRQNFDKGKDLGMVQPSSENTQLRRAHPSDAMSIRALTRTSYAKWVPIIGREPRPMAVDYHRAVREHMIDLLFVGPEMAGLIETVHKSDHLLIENVAVAPSFQGRGHGRYLLGHAEQLAASLRLPELRLYTNKQFAENIELYSQLGYTIDREEPFMGGITVHMNKPVTAA